MRSLVIAALLAAPLFAGSLTVTVKDPGGALVGQASVDVVPQAGGASLTKSTGGNGRAVFDQLPAGTWRVSVVKDGFAPWEGRATVGTRPVDLAAGLKLNVLSSSMQVSGRRSPLANSDPNYQALRNNKLSKVYRVSNLTVNRDAGVFTFRSGSFSFLPPVLGRVTTGVFVGDGNFRFAPKGETATTFLKRMKGSDSVDEDFTAMVVYFSDPTFDEIKQHSELVDEATEPHEEALQRVRNVIRTRVNESSDRAFPLSFLQRVLNADDMLNYDAEILAELYNREPAGSFRAFLRGRQYADLRFFVNPHGALPGLPQLKAPEEVALLYFNANSNTDGIWYLGHTLQEIQDGSANSKEEKRLIAPEHYKIESVLESAGLLGVETRMAVNCNIRFHPTQDGVRMAKFNLNLDLEILRVTWNGTEIPFVQEGRSRDGSFYLEMPEPMQKDRAYDIQLEYEGKKIAHATSSPGDVISAGLWYPIPTGPEGRATYDLMFRIPHGTVIVAVGNSISNTQDGKWDVSRWISGVPVTQVAFRWMDTATLLTSAEDKTQSQVSVYWAMKAQGLTPPPRDYVINETRDMLRLFSSWFGKPAYSNITLVVRNGVGSSLPGLIYAPTFTLAGAVSIASQLSTRSNGAVMSLGTAGNARGAPLRTMRVVFDEAFARQISRQWWGNMITPASFHDAWISGGLEGFSASVFDLAKDNGNYRDHWEDTRQAILPKNSFGIRFNDSGPLWMGFLNETQKTPFSNMTLEAKSSWIFQMLRSMMWDPQTLDRDFKTMMQDFVARFANQAVSTEDFRAVADKHMKPAMDLESNHRMDWFFNEWVYGTDIPAYKLDYSFQPDEKGGMLLTGKLTQSEVSPDFRMLVPVFVESGGKTARIAQVSATGNSTTEFKVALGTRPAKVLLNANEDVLMK